MPLRTPKLLAHSAFRQIITTASAWSIVAACGSATHAVGPGTAPATHAVAQTTSVGPTVSSTAPTTTPQCVGLSICPPPPPDAAGNPACYYADGWRAGTSGGGIEVWYFREPQSPSKADKVTVTVRRKDGTTQSQDASIDAGQQVHRFEFLDTPQASVDEVLLVSSADRCFVIGPGG